MSKNSSNLKLKPLSKQQGVNLNAQSAIDLNKISNEGFEVERSRNSLMRQNKTGKEDAYKTSLGAVKPKPQDFDLLPKQQQRAIISDSVNSSYYGGLDLNKRSRYVSNIRSRLESIETLLHNPNAQNKKHFDKLLNLDKLKRSEARSKMETDRAQSKLVEPPSNQMYENVNFGLPKIIKEQLQNDQKFEQIFVNDSALLVLNKLQPESEALRSKSVLNLQRSFKMDSQIRPNHQSYLSNRQQNVIKLVKNTDDFYKNQKTKQQNTEQSLGMASSQKVLEKQQVFQTQTFPIKRVEVRRQGPQQVREMREQLNAQMLRAVDNSNLDQRSFKFKSGVEGKYVSQQKIGEKKLIENEMILRSKLTLIDNVMNSHIDKNSDLSLGKQVVKVLDVSEYPKRKIPFKRKGKSPVKSESSEVEGPYGKQYNPVVYQSKVSDKRIMKDFLSGKSKITDHQGIELSPDGTKMDRLARIAVEDKKPSKRKAETKKAIVKTTLKDTGMDSDEYSDDFIQPLHGTYLTADELVRNFLKKKKDKKSLDPDSKKPHEIVIEPSTQHEHIDENTQIHQLQEIQTELNQQSEFQKTKNIESRELAPEVQDLIANIRHYNKMQQQEVYSGKLVKVHKKFHKDLVDQVEENGDVPYEAQHKNSFLALSPGTKNHELVRTSTKSPQRMISQELILNATGFPSIAEEDLDGSIQQIASGTIQGNHWFKRGFTVHSNMGKTLQTTNSEISNSHQTQDIRIQASNDNLQTSLQIKKQVTGFSDSDNSTQEQYNKQVKYFKKNGVKQKKGTKLDLMQKAAKMEVKDKKKAAKIRSKMKIEDEQRGQVDNGNRSAQLGHGNVSLVQMEKKGLENATNPGSRHLQKASEIYLKEQQKKQMKASAQKMMLSELKKKDDHVKAMKEATNMWKNLQNIETIEDNKTVSDEFSEVLSHLQIRYGRNQTEKEKQAEIQGLKAFLVECEKRKILTLPILKSLKNKSLKMVNVKMDANLIHALTVFIEQGAGGGLVLNKLILAQNQLSDDLQGKLLAPLGKKGAKTKSIVTISNIIGPHTLDSMLKVITPEPYQLNDELVTHNKYLQELNLNDCKILNSDILKQLLQALNLSSAGRLKYLGLSNQFLDEPISREIQEFVTKSSQIKKMDLSFVKLNHFQIIIDIVEALSAENKSLQSLNIGGVSVGGSAADLTAIETGRKYVEAVIKLAKESHTLVHLNLSACFPGIQVLKAEIKVKSNEPVTSFQGISGAQIQGKSRGNSMDDEEPFCDVTALFEAIRSSKSLQAVHYSGNNINTKTLKKIKGLLQIEDGIGFGTGGVNKSDGIDSMFGAIDEKMDMNKINEIIQQKLAKDQQKQKDQALANAFLIPKNLDASSSKSLTRSDIGSRKNFQNELNARHALHGQGNQENKKKIDLKQEVERKMVSELKDKDLLSLDFCMAERNIPLDDRFVFQRILGHQEIEFAYKWCFRDECWICAQWRYTLFIWSQSLAESGDLFRSKEQVFLREWEDLIIKNNNYSSYQPVFDIEQTIEEGSHSDVHCCPRVVGPATNFKFRKMIPMYNFIDKIYGNNRAYLRVYNANKEIARKLERKQAWIEDVSETQLHSNNKEWPFIIRNHLRQYDKQCHMSIKKLVRNKVINNTERYYCYADFFPPNPKTVTLAIQARNQRFLGFVSQKFGFRECDPQLSLKLIKRKQLERVFNLQNSMFDSWKVNLEEHYRKCFNADNQYSKIKKFVKGEQELKDVYKVLLDNYAIIYEQYLFGQGSSNYPSVGMVDFVNLCKAWGVINKADLSTQVIDQLFVAVNFEEVGGGAADLEDNPDKELCRYEFFEIIVRMAKHKFIEAKKKKSGPPMTIAQATQKLIDDYIKNYLLQQQWMNLRRNDIWTLEVHDVLEANKESIRTFMNWWIKKRSQAKSGKKALWLEDIRQQMATVPKLIDRTLQVELGLSDSQVTLCFANSKFIVIDEMCNLEFLMYLKYDEFLEYIVRLANQANFAAGATAGLQSWNVPESSDDEEMENGSSEELDELSQNRQNKALNQQSMLIQDKVFLVVDLILRLAKETGMNLRAVKPVVQGLGDSESDYESF